MVALIGFSRDKIQDNSILNIIRPFKAPGDGIGAILVEILRVLSRRYALKTTAII